MRQAARSRSLTRSRIASSLILGLAIFLGAVSHRPTAAAPALQATSTPAPSATSTSTPGVPFRPVVVLDIYSTGAYSITPGQEFDLSFRLRNAGAAKARNIIVVFGGDDLIPRVTGGVVAGGVLAPEASTTYIQPMTADPGLARGSIALCRMSITYNDDDGGSYSESFNLSFPVASPSTSGGRAAPTSTPTLEARPLLQIRDYQIGGVQLTPGTRFTLSLEIQNVGGIEARQVTLVVGGGSGRDPGSGTPVAGGISGASGSFSNFAPVDSSNVKFLGDLASGNSLVASQRLIVNSTTQPGAYPLTLSLLYADLRGSRYEDDQVVTLLVFLPPVIEASFYRPPDALVVGQPGVLPIQIVNLGRTSAVLGELEVSGPVGQFSDNTSLVGYLDPGLSFTLDASVIPDLSGLMEVVVTVSYLDDFNQAQQLVQSLTVEVVEAPVIGPGGEPGDGTEGPSAPEPESFWEKAWRFIRGLLGLDSRPPQGEPIFPEGTPEIAPPPVGPPIILPGPKG